MKIIAYGLIEDDELEDIKKMAIAKYGDDLCGLEITVVDEEYVDVKYILKSLPFERIRRITGYLVGTMDRWNNAKRSEERERVKHNT